MFLDMCLMNRLVEAVAPKIIISYLKLFWILLVGLLSFLYEILILPTDGTISDWSWNTYER